MVRAYRADESVDPSGRSRSAGPVIVLVRSEPCAAKKQAEHPVTKLPRRPDDLLMYRDFVIVNGERVHDRDLLVLRRQYDGQARRLRRLWVGMTDPIADRLGHSATAGWPR
jgi:hypothetical protein